LQPPAALVGSGGLGDGLNERMRVADTQTRQEGLSTFFNAMDEDGDGQIQEDEASNYLAGKVGGESFDTAKEIRQGVASFMHLVDSGDAGRAVSEAELEVRASHCPGPSSLLPPLAVPLSLRQPC
jgi:hypothetical protein